MKFLTLAILIVCLSYALLKPHNFDVEKWEKFKTKHGKKIHKNNELKRMEKFFEKLAKIEAQNDEYAQGKTSYYTDVNEMTDMDADELKHKTGFIPPQSSKSKRSISVNKYAFGPGRPTFKMFSADNGTLLPASVNWARSGWADPVWDQQDCGSCWAFSTDFIDCSGYLSTKGCSGGSQANALEYSILNGTTTAGAYKYLNAEGTCQTGVRQANPVYKITSFLQLESNHDTLKQAIAQLGPVTVSIDAEDGLFNYKGGIYNGKQNGVMECSADRINHAVTVVGYGTDATTGLDYWLIKNTWGTTWGEGGYVRFLRTKENLCGIYQYMYVPVIV
ncbi:unnamed protein product [Brachionus calyciflorus]|uniref:Uncharacterized protein n=1 Tax=Brachionus calyciflorus TaxID=104777 RepID=A0A813N4B1_9BILA|nr:unnamed protein product [Brachionus calyciflorus]